MTATLKSSELRAGDVVHCHGMRCLIDQPIESREIREYGQTHVFWTSALVTNIDEVADEWLVGMTRQTTGWPEHRATGEHRWTIQGNDNAHWCVERDGVCARCDQSISLAGDGAWEDESGACGCGDAEHEPA
jgi:hypothetical protein